MVSGLRRTVGWLAATLCLAACADTPPPSDEQLDRRLSRQEEQAPIGSSLLDLFIDDDNPNVTIEVNKYIWNASLDVLNFMPIERVDPFSGLIVMGYGTPPGGRAAYRATIYVRDPALEARSLDVALATRSGPASADTTRAVEDAILTRARQLRVRDLGL